MKTRVPRRSSFSSQVSRTRVDLLVAMVICGLVTGVLVWTYSLTTSTIATAKSTTKGPAIDVSYGCGASSSTCSFTLETTYYPDILACIVEGNGATLAMSGGGLMWHQRGPTVHYLIYGAEFYAITSSAQWPSLTATSSGTSVATECFGVFDANTTAPFDPHAGLPYTSGDSGSSAPSITDVSTSHAKDMLISLVAEAGTGQTIPPAGFTLVFVGGNRAAVAYRNASSIQSGLAEIWGTSVSGWVMFADAIQAAGTSTTPSTSNTTSADSNAVVSPGVYAFSLNLPPSILALLLSNEKGARYPSYADLRSCPVSGTDFRFIAK